MARAAGWKTGFTALLIGAVIAGGGTAAWADAGAADTSAVTASAANYGLTPDIRAAIKNIAVEKTAGGYQLAATVRVYNGSDGQKRVPDHELRLRMTDGLVYTLQASATNKGALQPKEISELTYVAVLDSATLSPVESVSFIDVDMYAYPKKETTLLTIPAESVWYGTGGEALRALPSSAWKQPFAIPGINSSIVYTPVDASIQDTDSGRAAVVKLIAENTGYGRETIPAFRVDGRSGEKAYEGKASEQNAVTLEAGEKKELYFTIPVDSNDTLSELVIMVSDLFVAKAGDSGKAIQTGKWYVSWPSREQSGQLSQAYTIGSPIVFDAGTTAVTNTTEVALMELHLHENPDEGYKTAVAKFKVTNNSNVPAAMPVFATELVSGSGAAYKGSRQANAAATIGPGLGYIVSYSFALPQTEQGDGLVVKLLDTKVIQPYTTPIASLQTAAQTDLEEDTFSLYPFDVKLNRTDISYSYAQLQYMYKINVDLDIVQKENVVVDNNFSKLRFEIVDGLGRVLGAKDAAFVGANKLISGKQTITANDISSDQMVSPVSLNIYEIIETGSGTAKRLLKQAQ